jgi:hypothetical protein
MRVLEIVSISAMILLGPWILILCPSLNPRRAAPGSPQRKNHANQCKRCGD